MPTTAPIPILPEQNWWVTARENGMFYWVRMLYVVVVHFVMSLHNGWIDPRLRMYDQIVQNRQ